MSLKLPKKESKTCTYCYWDNNDNNNTLVKKKNLKSTIESSGDQLLSCIYSSSRLYHN